MKILFVWSDTAQEHNCSNFRCFIPAIAMRRAGYDADLINVDTWANHQGDADEMTKAADLIIIQRNMFLQVLTCAAYWKARGKIIAVDLDDAYQFMTEATGSPSYNFWINGKVQDGEKNLVIKPPPVEILKWGVKIVDAIISPSYVICDDWRDYTRTYYVPNYLDLRHYRRKEVHKEPGAVYLGWGGSKGHTLSWSLSGVTQALKQLCRENKNLRVVMVGDDPIVRSLDIRTSQRVSMDWRPYTLWHEVLSVYDVGLVPLAGEYDRRRSCLKSCELSIMDIPWVGSDLEPNRIIGTGTLTVNTAQDWYARISNTLEYLPLYKLQAENGAVAVIRDYDVNLHTADLMSMYLSIVEEAA